MAKPTIRGMRLKLAWPATCLLSVATLSTGSGQAPDQVEHEDHVKTRLHTMRLRIEPTRAAAPGACQGLAASDLKISLGGRRIVDAGSIILERERQPTLHALLIDTSTSLRGKLERVRQAAAQYVEQLPAGDKALVATFDDSVVLCQSATGDKRRLLATIEQVRLGQSTSLLDGLYYILSEIEIHPERPVLLLLTDGVDSASLHQRADVLERAAGRSDLNIFTIGLGLPAIQTAGPAGLVSPRKFLQQLAMRTNGRLFDVPTGSGLAATYDRIREALASEATLVVVDPDPESDPGRLGVSSRRADCRVEALESRPEPPWRPAFTGLSLQPSTAYAKRRLIPREHEVDPACLANGNSLWMAQADQGAIRGCTLDLVMDFGVLYDPSPPNWVSVNEWLLLATRPFEVDAPPLAKLPEHPTAVLDRLAAFAVTQTGRTPKIDGRKQPARKHARPYRDYHGLVHGRTFFELRPDLARVLFTMPDYREWALRKLRDETDRELDRLGALFGEHAPSVSREELSLLAHESPRGKRSLARAEEPSAADLMPYLAAWLGDISAHDLFVGWEMQHLPECFQAKPEDIENGFFQEWRELRRIFWAPSYTRALTLLSPMHDRESDRVGFWRVILPRPIWIAQRIKGYERDPDFNSLPLDLVPDLPLGYWALARLVELEPRLGPHLAQRGFKPTALSYALLGKPRKHDPERAFESTHVSLVLEQGSAQLRLAADLELNRDDDPVRPKFSTLELEASGDPVLEELALAAEAAAVPAVS